MRRQRSRIAVALAAGMGIAAMGLGACFPDYGFATGDAGSSDSTTGADGLTQDSGVASDSTTTGDSATGDSKSASDSMSTGDTSPAVDTGTPVLDGSFYEGSVPTGMTLFQPGVFHISVYTADNSGNRDAAVDATVTLQYAFAIDTTEVTTGAFQGWLDAGLPAPAGDASLDPGGAFDTTMVWNGQWTSDHVQGTTNAAFLGYDAGCSNTGGVPATLPRGVSSLPVTCVNWFQAQAFCAWQGKRLPTDTEWRVAATVAGTSPEYPWGGTTDPMSCSLVTGDIASPTNCGFPVPVGNADAGGTATTPQVFDLVGSLDEWMWDYVYPNGYTYPASATNFSGPPLTTQTDVQRQYFGGCYYDNDPVLFQSRQPGAVSAGGDQGYDQTGFRCAKTL